MWAQTTHYVNHNFTLSFFYIIFIFHCLIFFIFIFVIYSFWGRRQVTTAVRGQQLVGRFNFKWGWRKEIYLRGFKISHYDFCYIFLLVIIFIIRFNLPIYLVLMKFLYARMLENSKICIRWTQTFGFILNLFRLKKTNRNLCTFPWDSYSPIYPIPPGLFLFNFAAAQYPYPSCLAAGLRVEYWSEDGGKSWGFLAREKKL